MQERVLHKEFTCKVHIVYRPHTQWSISGSNPVHLIQNWTVWWIRSQTPQQRSETWPQRSNSISKTTHAEKTEVEPAHQHEHTETNSASGKKASMRHAQWSSWLLGRVLSCRCRSVFIYEHCSDLNDWELGDKTIIQEERLFPLIYPNKQQLLKCHSMYHTSHHKLFMLASCHASLWIIVSS